MAQKASRRRHSFGDPAEGGAQRRTTVTPGSEGEKTRSRTGTSPSREVPGAPGSARPFGRTPRRRELGKTRGRGFGAAAALLTGKAKEGEGTSTHNPKVVALPSATTWGRRPVRSKATGGARGTLGCLGIRQAAPKATGVPRARAARRGNRRETGPRRLKAAHWDQHRAGSRALQGLLPHASPP